MVSAGVRRGPIRDARLERGSGGWPTYRLTALMSKAQVANQKGADDLGFHQSRLSESNRRPIHYESACVGGRGRELRVFAPDRTC
jgi:hypothetical protein